MLDGYGNKIEPVISLDELAKDKPRPIAIWNDNQVRAYYEATDEDRRLWNIYAQSEADAFDNDPHRDSYDSTHVFVSHDPETGRVTPWAPPMTFTEWKESL